MKCLIYKRYRKRSVTVRAKQLTEDVAIHTLEGEMLGKKGDYLVIGVKGELYPVRKDIFEITYEELME